jgi:hypothetical protein
MTTSVATRSVTAVFYSAKAPPKFCSMRITQDVRKLAADAKKLSLELAPA